MSVLNSLVGPEDRDRIIHILETSLSVSKATHFFAWTQGPLQALLPHEIIVCGHAQAGQSELELRYFTATRYFKQQHFEAACSPRNGLFTKAIRRWQRSPQPCLVPPPPGHDECEPEWPEILVRLELKNLAFHGVRSPTGAVQSWFGLSRVPTLDANVGHLLELLAPCISATYARVVAAEFDSHAGDFTLRNLLTPREIEVIHMVRDGFSNPQIAEQLDISMMTAKNHVQNIRSKLKVRTRGQAVVEAMKLGLILPVREEN